MRGPEPDDELVGRAVGSYRIVRLLGKGGMGSVYLGEHPVIGSRVAVKFLHSKYAQDGAIVDRFFNEARAVNLIGHDNILQILDLDVTEDGRHYFVMEYLRGRPLQSFVRGGQRVPLPVSGPILLQCCAALQAAHDKGIVHRDLKPDNVYLIARNGRKNFVKLVDFGIAKLTPPGDAGFAQRTQTGMVMGTPAYMSPEQGAGAIDRIDGRSDVYSLGVMMYQMATGRLPFAGANFGEVLVGHLQRPPPSPRGIDPHLPAAWEAVVLRCLAKEPRDRFQSMGELRLAIADVLASLGIEPELPPVDEDTSVDLLAPVLPTVPSAPGPRTPPPGTLPGWPKAGKAFALQAPAREIEVPSSAPSRTPSTQLEEAGLAGRRRPALPGLRSLSAFVVAAALAAAACALSYLRMREGKGGPAQAAAPAASLAIPPQLATAAPPPPAASPPQRVAAASPPAAPSPPQRVAAASQPVEGEPRPAAPQADRASATPAGPARKPRKRNGVSKARARDDGLLEDVFK